MSTSRPTPSRKSSDGKRRSAPTPSSSKKDATAKTPASILKTSRRGIKVTRTEKASDGYADDSPYWAAAKLASTQPTNDDDDDSSSEESMNSTEKRQLEKKAKRDQKKIQKKKETLEQRRKLKQKYMDGQAKVKPNFKGAESDDGEDSSRASGDEKMNGDSTQNGEWLKETLDEKRKSKNMFSPSDLSRASTIPPTPASTKTAKSANSLGDLNISVDMDGNDDANEFHVSYDNEDDDVGENSENDNDQPLASSLSPIHEEEHVAGERKQYGLEDKIEDIIETIEPQTPAKSMQANDNDNDSDGGYDEGPGFELNDDMPSPPAPSPPQSDNEEDKSSEKLLLPTLRSSPRSSSKKRSRTESVEDSDSEDSKKAEKARKEKKKKSKRGRPRKKKVNFSQGYQTGPREYRTIPAEEFEGEDGPAGVRRSKRRKFEPLQFWKNEKIVYEANRDDDDDAEIFGDMPMVTGIQKAEPTPYKKRSITRRVESDDESAATGKKSRKKSSSVSQEDAPFDCSKLRKKVNIIDGDKGFVWNEHSSSAEEMKLIQRRAELKLMSLPVQKGVKRTKEDGKVTVKAAQAFNVPPQSAEFPGFICGCMELPPKGIKDEEGVGPCAQVFNVGDCQPNSLEVSIADPDSHNGDYVRETASRYLLSKGDFFHVPAGNIYRIQNHSKTTSCELNWIIIRT